MIFLLPLYQQLMNETQMEDLAIKSFLHSDASDSIYL